MSANDKQVGGEHYKRYAVEPWDFIVKNGLSYLAGNVIKYVVRADAKDGVKDIDKAIHYLEKMREQIALVERHYSDTAQEAAVIAERRMQLEERRAWGEDR